MEKAFHNINPVFDSSSKILILGSFPSVKSREAAFFYHHPQNRFWQVIANITNERIPISIDEKKELLLKHNIAIWDVIKSCTIEGSSDSSIKDVIPNDLNIIFNVAGIEKIFSNGNTSYTLFNKYSIHYTNLSAIKLPSTSPANAKFSLENLCKIWKNTIY